MTEKPLSADEHRLLRRIAAGDAVPTSRETASPSPRYAMALEDLQRLRSMLDKARVSLDQRADPEPFAGAASFVHRELHRVAGVAHRHRQSGRRRARQRTAAAVLLGAAFVAWALAGDGADGGKPPVRPSRQMLGSERVRCEHPRGEVAAFGAFWWSGSRPPRSYRVVSVYTSDRQHLVVRSPDLETDTWTPAGPLPAEIYWEVTVFDASGNETARGGTSASRP